MPPKIKKVRRNEESKDLGKPRKDRKAIPLSVKLDVIKRIDDGQRNKDVMLAHRLSSSTVRTIYMQKEKILKTAVGGASLTALSVTRHPIMEKLEHLLLQWIEDSSKHYMTLSFLLIREKALSLFERLKAQAIEEGDETAKDLKFKGSHGWFDRFRKRRLLHNLKVTGEAVSAETPTASVFPEELTKLIEEGGYINKQIFNMGKTGLFWKRMMSCTYISRDENQAKGRKASNDRVTLLLGGNAEGDVKLKPLLIYHSENPQALTGINKVNLPVIWHSNRSAWVAQHVFLDYVQRYFCPFIEKYCKENNLDNKALLIIENAPGHPATVVDYSSNVQVVFLPSNTTFLLQPMEQGVIAIFKAYYMQLVMQYIISGLNKSDTVTVRDLWKNYNIKMAIENIAIAWDKVRGNTMINVWKKLPEAMHDFHCFETMKKTICLDIVQLAVKAGFNEVNIEDVQELLESHSEDLSDDELYQQKENFLKEDAEPLKEGIFNKEEETVKEFGTKELHSLFSFIDSACALVDENDSNFERARKAKILMRESIECYRQLYNRKVREAKQRSVLHFSRLATPAAAATSEPQTSCSEISCPTIAMEEEEVANADDPEIMELEEDRHSLSSSLLPSFSAPCSPVPPSPLNEQQ